MFHIPPAEIDRIREQADAGMKIEPLLVAEVRGSEGQLVARVEKRLYVRKKRADRALTASPPSGRGGRP
jgi:hypothetical protein